MKKLAIILTLALLSTDAQSEQPCSSAEARHFDFWVGSWRVENPQGKLVGHNLITKTHGGCVLEERWKGQSGMTGSSLNIYDAATRQWHQTWADSEGLLLLLSGPSKPGMVTMSGRRPGPKGTNLLDRITWTRLEQGRVRQLWEQSEDGGKSWTVYFDGRYIPETKTATQP